MGCEIVIEANLAADQLRAMSRKDPNRREVMRMLAIANEFDGYDRDEAARLAGMSDQALRGAIKRFNAEGTDGLRERPRPERRCRLDAAQDAAIKAAVPSGPDIPLRRVRSTPCQAKSGSTRWSDNAAASQRLSLSPGSVAERTDVWR